MSKNTPAAEQFTRLGITPDQYTPAMELAVKQRWSNLPVDEKVDDLRRRLAAVQPEAVPDVTALIATVTQVPGEALADTAAREHKRMKRNASVNAWRARNQIQAALDARELKFAAMRAGKGKAKTLAAAS